ncbi:Glycosyltransferase 64 protein C4 [Bonamia ostreae]|uniref:Glycosyltransferase 64 protein C4 n=1 Tax=Bonamia ostreae TaxID=126728 RepID=A0ABV2AJ38_9EUKA
MENKVVENTVLTIVRLKPKKIPPQKNNDEKSQIDVKDNKTKETVKESIPIPLAQIKKRTRAKRSWQCPKFYIKNSLASGSSLPTIMDFYDMSSDDLEWLKSVRTRNKDLKLDKIQMSKLIEYFEHFYRIDDSIPNESKSEILSLSKAKKIGFIFGIKNEIVSVIYDYWQKKLLKPLIRCYIKRPEQDDPSIYTSFRPRKISRRASTRSSNRTFRNDREILVKVKILKKDLTHLLKLLSLVRLREEKKLEQMLYDALIFDRKLLITKYGNELYRKITKNENFLNEKSILKPVLPYEAFFSFVFVKFKIFANFLKN